MLRELVKDRRLKDIILIGDGLRIRHEGLRYDLNIIQNGNSC